MEAECLRKYFDELTLSIGTHEVTTLIVTQLYGKGVLTAQIKSDLLSLLDSSEPHKAAITSVVAEIQACVSSDPHQLSVVLEVLRTHESCRSVAEKISYMVTNGGKAPPLNAHNALRLLQDSRFNVTKYWHQMGGDLGVSLDNRRRLQELAIRTQNYDGALEECLDWWISNMPDASWAILVETIERHEVSTADRMRDLLGLPKIQRTIRSGRLPRQGSSLEGVTDHVETSNPLAPNTNIPIRQTPSPSTATTGTTTTEQTHQPNQPNHTSIITNNSSTARHKTTSSQPMVSTPYVDTPHHSTSNGHSKDGASNICSASDNPQKSGFHMECQLLNGSSNKVIKSSQTSVADIKAPVYRDIRVKKVSRYASVPPLTPLIVTVTVNSTCYLYIINIGSTGNITTLIPNALDDDNKAEEGQVLQFPPPDADYEFELDSNSGTEIVVVLAYNQDVSVDQAKDDYRKMKEKVVVERDITIKKKKKVTPIPIGTVEMQFSVKPS